MDPSQYLQVAFLSAAVTVLLVDNLPALRTRYIPYGPRATISKQDSPPAKDPKADQSVCAGSKGLSASLLDALATFQVPHSFFIHFYIVSLVSSGFWTIQLITKGFAFRKISQNFEPIDRSSSMSVDQVALTWALMTAQGTRRLLESIYLSKNSTSQMWFIHWLLGNAFYITVGVALWIEGVPALVVANPTYSGLTMSAPSLRTMIGIPVFLLSSGIQHDCHAYLASLPKYSIPMHPIFQSLICPHYFAECMIYLSLAIIGAPKGALCNKTILCAFIFVATNLAVTASTTKEWYERRFGKDKVMARWRMVPWLF